MKFKLLILYVFTTLNVNSQITKTEKTNILLIVGSVNPILSEFLINPNINSSYVLSAHNYDFKFGEYIEKEEPNKNDTLHYNENGFLKFDYLKSERGTQIYFDYNDYPIQIGLKGEFKNKKNYKYKYNEKGLIIDIVEYNNDGDRIENHFGFKYNLKNQIIEKLFYNGNGIYVKSISSYTYNNNGDITLLKNYSKTDDKNFPICEHYKLKYTYNSNNQLIKYSSYETDYGYYWLIGKDLYKYSKGKKTVKTLVENQKDMNESYKESQKLDYEYNSITDEVWSSKTEYTINKYDTVPKKYIEKIYQKKIE